MTPKEQRFVQEYLVDLCAAKAAERAGYSAKTAKSQGHDLLKKPAIQDAIAEAQAKRSERTAITADRVLSELAKVGFSNILDYVTIGPDGDPFVDLSGMTRETGAAVKEITVEDYKDGRGKDARDVRRVKFALNDKLGALTQIGKHLGMFKERFEHSGPDGAPIDIQTIELVGPDT